MFCDLWVLVVALVVPFESFAFFIGQVVFDVSTAAGSKLGCSCQCDLELIRLHFFVSFFLVHHSFHCYEFGSRVVFVCSYLF